MPARPDFPIVDTHVHLWDPDRVHYAWMSGVPRLNRRFDLGDLAEHAAGTEIEHAVFLECDVAAGADADERALVRSIADEDPRLGAFVHHAPIEKADALAARLEVLAEDPRVRGVRRLLQAEEDPRFALRADFLTGIRSLAAHGLHFEICIVHPQMEAAVALAEACPQVRFVLDHLGKPGIAAGLLDPWREHLRALGRLPNVWCKFSGLVTEADHEGWTPGDLRPYFEHALDCFPEDRRMFGGDWPVALLATDYPRWVETAWALSSGLDDGARRRLFRDNALEFYGLGPAGRAAS